MRFTMSRSSLGRRAILPLRGFPAGRVCSGWKRAPANWSSGTSEEGSDGGDDEGAEVTRADAGGGSAGNGEDAHGGSSSVTEGAVRGPGEDRESLAEAREAGAGCGVEV